MKIDMEKFDGAINFVLWQIQMSDLLVQNSLEAAIEEWYSTVPKADGKRLHRKARFAICLCLSSNVLREIHMETTVARLWSKLKALYLLKSIANQSVLKQGLYTLHMAEGTLLKCHISEFNTLINDL